MQGGVWFVGILGILMELESNSKEIPCLVVYKRWNWNCKEGMKSHRGGNLNSMGGGRDFKIPPSRNLHNDQYTLHTLSFI